MKKHPEMTSDSDEVCLPDLLGILTPKFVFPICSVFLDRRNYFDGACFDFATNKNYGDVNSARRMSDSLEVFIDDFDTIKKDAIEDLHAILQVSTLEKINPPP
jgi:hypothetical protein